MCIVLHDTKKMRNWRNRDKAVKDRKREECMVYVWEPGKRDSGIYSQISLPNDFIVLREAIPVEIYMQLRVIHRWE